MSATTPPTCPQCGAVILPLVDTNNTALKTTKITLSFAPPRPRAEIGGVRPGMTMEEVVSAWGKPVPACYMPARRAARVDPVVTLRCEQAGKRIENRCS